VIHGDFGSGFFPKKTRDMLGISHEYIMVSRIVSDTNFSSKEFEQTKIDMLNQQIQQTW
jgi:hypothetical protein